MHLWEVGNLTVSDLVVVALMIVVFVLAVTLPYPKRTGRGRT